MGERRVTLRHGALLQPRDGAKGNSLVPWRTDQVVTLEGQEGRRPRKSNHGRASEDGFQDGAKSGKG